MQKFVTKATFSIIFFVNRFCFGTVLPNDLRKVILHCRQNNTVLQNYLKGQGRQRLCLFCCKQKPPPKAVVVSDLYIPMYLQAVICATILPCTCGDFRQIVADVPL